jgi:DNA-binding GntR family transcriptional regulator
LPFSPQTLKRGRSLHEQAYQTLRAAVLAGELLPGQRLVETTLAEKLRVSRTPIREALHQLQNEDLVTADDNGILRVTVFTVEDALQLYDCRIALEQLSATLACQNYTDPQLKAMQQNLTQAEKLSKAKPTTLTNFQLLDADYQFHRQIAEMSDNSWLRSLLDQVFDKMALLRIQTIQQNRDVLNIFTEHRLVYEAIRNRDGERTAQAIIGHLTAAKARVVLEMQSLQKPAEDIV